MSTEFDSHTITAVVTAAHACQYYYNIINHIVFAGEVGDTADWEDLVQAVYAAQEDQGVGLSKRDVRDIIVDHVIDRQEVE